MTEFTSDLNQQTGGGKFRAPLAGTYACAANIVLMQVNAGSYYRVLISIDGNKEIRTSRHAINGDAQNERAIPVGGIMQLNAGQQVMVYVYSNNDGSYRVSSESGFHCAYLGSNEQVESFSAVPSGSTNSAGVNPQRMRNFRTSGASYAYSNTRNFDGDSNTYRASKSGLYMMFASLRFDGMNDQVGSLPFFRVKIGKSHYNDFHGSSVYIVGRPPSNYFTMHLTASALLQAGDVVDVQTTSRRDQSWILQVRKRDVCSVVSRKNTAVVI